MNMASIQWSLLVILIAFITQAKCESTVFPVIPKHLLECYTEEGMYHRQNRIPNSFESFLDLLRKVEESPTSRNMNARELSLALLHYLKLDGIQSLQGHTNYFTSNIIPFAPSGAEYFKHRLTLIGLLPRIDRGYMTAFNETLTKKDMCNLHFMLSYSIDPYKRRDERCSPLFEESRRSDSPDRRPDWDVRNYYRRHRRHIDHGESLNGMKGKRREMGKREMLKKDGMESGEVLERRRRHEKDRNLEVEEIPVQQIAKGNVPHEEKDKFTIGTQELLSDGERYRQAELQSLVQMRTFGRYGGRVFGSPVQSSDESPISGVIPGIPLSDCPVVNGVINTPFGSLTIGTVIAGIAAGLNPEEIPPTRLSVDPTELESPADRVKNIWAATLAGTIADTLSSTALMQDSLQVLKGGWNDSSDPKWYLLSNSDFKHLPEVTLRGSLDGFLLGINAKQWTDKFPSYKLSQLLQTFYDSVWKDVGASNRAQMLPKYAPEETFRKQTHLMSLVMQKQKTQSLTVLDYGPIVRSAVSKVMQHIGTMDNNARMTGGYIGSFQSTRVDNSVNMVAVIDSSWEHENLFKIFQMLRYAQVASTVGNNLTVVCGKNGRVLLSSDNSVSLYNLFTKEMLFENCSRGFDLPLIFDRLDALYRKILYDEKMTNKMITASQVVVLFPYEPLLQENTYVVEKSKNFASNFPDVRLMVTAGGRAETFRPLVKDPKDLFSVTPPSIDPDMKTVKVFAEGVKQSFFRLSRPSCGSYFDDETPNGDAQVIRDVPPGSIAYYRLLPQYFYTQHETVTVTIRSKHRVALTVCHSREEERPIGPTPRWNGQEDAGSEYVPNRHPDYAPDRFPEYRPDFPPEASPYGRQTEEEEEGRVTCKTITSETYNIEMKDPCRGASNLQECHPLYISLSPPLQDSFRVTCPNCRLPTNVQYEIAMSGLTCYNSAAVRLLSPVLLFLLFIRYLLL